MVLNTDGYRSKKKLEFRLYRLQAGLGINQLHVTQLRNRVTFVTCDDQSVTRLSSNFKT